MRNGMKYRVIVKSGKCWCPNCNEVLRFRSSNGCKRKRIGKYCEYCGIEIVYPKRIIGGEGIFDDEISEETLFDKEEREVLSNVLNNVTVINRFRHKIEPKISECDERTQRDYKAMCNAIDNLINYANTIK